MTTLERVNYEFTDERVDILPLDDVLMYQSVDNYSYWEGSYGPVWQVLSVKRQHAHYPDLVEELRTNGFTKGIRIHPHTTIVLDGHHRIAAAVELGMSFIPVVSEFGSDYDSGYWR